MAGSKTGQFKNAANFKVLLSDARSAADASARPARSGALYEDTICLVAIADVKNYVRAAFGADSPQYAQIKDLKFTLPR